MRLSSAIPLLIGNSWMETSRHLSQFVGEEKYNVVPFLTINDRINMALDQTMKTILIYVGGSK